MDSGSEFGDIVLEDDPYAECIDNIEPTISHLEEVHISEAVAIIQQPLPSLGNIAENQKCFPNVTNAVSPERAETLSKNDVGGKLFDTDVHKMHSKPNDKKIVFRCSQCSKRFANDDYRVKHEETHDLLKCPFLDCDRTFVYRSRLNRHVVMHTGERPYKCQLCPSTFPRKDGLNLHMKCVHKARTNLK